MSTRDTTIDLRHLGRTEYVASQVLVTIAGPVLVDVGPGSTLDTLEAGLDAVGVGFEDLHAVLLSHIHFDHAGAAGLLVQRNPGLTVYVHRAGARHLADPSKLVASATRIYGSRMDELWGPLLPVPESNLRPLDGGEHLIVGGRVFEVYATPGHASHHVVYFERASGTAFVGDTAGIKVPALPIALPVTPPPDFDLEAWVDSLELIRALSPRHLMSTHYGIDDDPPTRLDSLQAGLTAWAEHARELLEDDDLDDTSRADRFHDRIMTWLGERADAAAIRTYAEFADFRASYHGIARYWRKRVTAA